VTRAAVIVGGCALLAMRPALFGVGPAPGLVIATIFLVLLAGALVVPVGGGAPPTARWRATLVLVAGCAAFVVGRAVAGGHSPSPLDAQFVALNTLAAIAEEAFFRRLVYGALASLGAAFAVVGTAVLFALVHLTVYGAWVLPLDLAAGLLLGWQRWASNSWSVPAATHAVANVLVIV
jgi:membrane protease YdiL (CAAX protease family)